jgi:hypothetical protein
MESVGYSSSRRDHDDYVLVARPGDFHADGAAFLRVIDARPSEFPNFLATHS